MDEELSQAWELISSSLMPRLGQIAMFNEIQLKAAVDLHKQQGLANIIEEWFLEATQEEIQMKISPEFWKNYKRLINSEKFDEPFCSCMEELHYTLSKFNSSVKTLDYIRRYINECEIPTINSQLQFYYKALMFYCTPKYFDTSVERFYSLAFKVFQNQDKDADHDTSLSTDGESLYCQGCSKDTDDCICQDVMDKFHLINRLLNELGLLERICGEAITEIIHQQIKHHIDLTCKGNFEISYSEVLEKWLEDKVVGWISWIYKDTINTTNISDFKQRLYYYMYETYAQARIQQLFNIIIEFPESEPAIVDLKNCLEKTDLRSTLVTSLKTALETRLLHPGVNTADILTAYVGAIKGLRVLDPTGVILELVCEPVRKYLRNRDDTVKCIVSDLTEGGNSDLSDELIKGHALVLDESYHSDDENEDWESWMPDPVDADPAKTSKSRRTSDIISMLVNIYGSKDLFVNEYRNLLADRILTNFNILMEKEIRYLELLKLRFGEAHLHFCEVMLKDVADSKRIHTNVKDDWERKYQNASIFLVESLILSAQFWPTFREEKLKLPEEWQTSLDAYTKAFETLKGNRSLNWKPHVGLMAIEVELKDRTLCLNVSPIHATILYHFQDKNTWTVDELSIVMQMPSSALRRKITFWQSQGILKEETTDTFVLIEESKGRPHDVIVEEEEMESAMASAEDKREEELQVYWSYIVGMLTNLESLPLERIHSMLRMFAMQGPASSDVSVQELKMYLDRKVREQKLVYSGGVYRLAKPGT